MRPLPYRHDTGREDKVIVACLIENPYLSSMSLLIQLLPAALANELSHAERLHQLQFELFKDLEEFRRSLQGCLGHFKREACTMPLGRALSKFNERYSPR